MNSEYAYFFGFPARQWKFAAGMLLLAGMMGFFAFFAFLGAYHEPDWAYVVLKGAVAVFAAWGCWEFLTGMFGGLIVPYFDRRIGVTSTFGQGHALARNCRRLDRLAVERGVMPISLFGFADDIRGETLVWHDPQSGIETISALLDALGDDGKDRKLIEELNKIRDALQVATEKGAKFCLMLRGGDGTNSQEIAMRAGSFF